MKRLLIPIAALALLAACGGGASAPASSAPPAARAAASKPAAASPSAAAAGEKPAASAAAKPAASGAAAAAAPSIDAQAVKAEGKAAGYGVLVDSQWKTLSDLMTSKYGIGVENFRGDTTAVLARINTEEAAGKNLWDMVVLEGPFIDTLAKQNYIQKLPPALINRFPEKWRDPNGNWVSFTLFPLTVIYNTDLVPKDQAPKSMDDLTDPRWKGKIAMTDPVLNEAFMRWFQVIREKKGAQADAYFKALAANNPTFFQSGLTVSTNVNQGQFPIGVGFMTHVLSVGGKNGHMAFMAQDPMPTTSGAFALAANPPHPNASKALADLFLSESYLQASGDLGYPITLPGVKSAIPEANGLNYEDVPELPQAKFDESQTYFKGIFKK
jgi:iron(III) transport system substrate-binding protein